MFQDISQQKKYDIIIIALNCVKKIDYVDLMTTTDTGLYVNGKVISKLKYDTNEKFRLFDRKFIRMHVAHYS